jgi:hypothetical protein
MWRCDGRQKMRHTFGLFLDESSKTVACMQHITGIGTVAYMQQIASVRKMR